MKKLLCLPALLFLFSCGRESKTVEKQRGCGFEINDTIRIKDKSAIEIPRSLATDTGPRKSFVPQQEELSIPVIFHVIYNNGNQNIPAAKIIQELNDLNLDFRMKNPDIAEVFLAHRSRIANPRINFVIADTLFPSSPDKGIKRVKGKSSGNLYEVDPVIQPAKYMNVYTGNIGSDGFTYSYPWSNPKSDAIYLYYKWVGGRYRLLTHETGHWLGLYHTFEGKCSTENDGMADTPPQRGSTGLGIACDSVKPWNRCSGAEIPMFNNFMDYSDCRKMFTKDQVDWMHYVIQKHRSQLKN